MFDGDFKKGRKTQLELTLCILMDSSFWFDTINWGSGVSICRIFLRIDFQKM